MIRDRSSRTRCNTAQALLGAAVLALLACSEWPLGPRDRPHDVLQTTEQPNQPAIAFVSTRDGSAYIYVADADGSRVARLAPGKSPAWSWDGRRIAFVRDGSNGQPSALYVIDANGSNERRVTSDALSAAWSPDGRITFHTPSTGDGSGGIWVVNDDGTERRLLLAHAWASTLSSVPGYGEAVQFPTWSPNGRSVAFFLYAGYMDPAGVGLMNPDGSDPRRLPTGINSWGAPAWSPDGSRIAFHSPSSGILTVPATGSGLPETHYVSALGKFQNELDWSADGRQIVFAEGGRFPNTKNRILVLTLETGEVRQLIADATNPARASYDDREPVWSRVRR